jgi:hypothetical protein
VKRYKLEMLGVPGAEPMWFDSRKELVATVVFMKDCPVDDGPIRLQVTEFSQTKVEVL